MGDHPALATGEPNQLLTCYLLQLIVLLLAALLAGVVSFLPITSYAVLVPTGAVSEKDNLVFYAHLAKYRKRQLIDSFAKAVGANESDAQQYHEMLAEQIIVNSRITLAKYQVFKVGAYALLFGLATPFFGLIALVIARWQRSAVDGY